MTSKETGIKVFDPCKLSDFHPISSRIITETDPVWRFTPVKCV